MNAQTTTAENIGTDRNGANRAQTERNPSKDSSELSKLLADIEDLVNRAARAADVDVEGLRRKVAWRLNSAGSAIAEGGRRVGATARVAASATDGYVRASPWQAVGIATFVGAAVGYLVARR